MSSIIVLPVDGSAGAAEAAAVAADWAGVKDARVIVLHVLDRELLEDTARRRAEVHHVASHGAAMPPWVANAPAELVDMLRPTAAPETEQEALEEIERRIVGSVTDILEERGIEEDRIRILFRDGNVARRIVEVAEEEGAEMIVMGSRGMSPTAGLLLGSVSERVGQRAPCTVVLARPRETAG